MPKLEDREGERTSAEAMYRWNVAQSGLQRDTRPFQRLSAVERRARLEGLAGAAEGLLPSADERAAWAAEEIALEAAKIARRS